jgi:uncharacterized protein with HEPN domain
MVLAATDARDFAGGLDQTQFNASRLHQAAVIRCIEVIGEAASKVSPAFRAAHPEIAWRDIIGMRHQLINNYAAIKLDIVWDVLQVRLPGLIVTLKLLIPAPDDPEKP